MSEIELILTTILNCQRHELYFNQKRLSSNQLKTLLDIVKLRAAGLPLQYLLSFTEFMGLKFKVRQGVFIPRPETEILVETAIKQISDVRSQMSDVNILDLGTGSGCIAISLAKFLANVEVIATDISEAALEVAKENAELNNVADRVKFVQSDLFSKFEIRNSKFEIIVSNPPYICSKNLDSLPCEVRYEPRAALDGGADGLIFFRRLINNSPLYLKKSGLLIMELGFGQVNSVKHIAEDYGILKPVEVVKDYNGIDRVLVLKKENG